jgi:hypothetical protein
MGKQGVDTAWLSIKADAPQDWLKPYGGEATEAIEVLANYLGYTVVA